MIDVDSIALIQIDATVITGILILLTIGRSNTYEVSKWTASVVLPFIGSAIIELFFSVLIDPPIEIRHVSIAFMITGFVYIGAIILKLPKIKSI